jgi:hypothetical protein
MRSGVRWPWTGACVNDDGEWAPENATSGAACAPPMVPSVGGGGGGTLSTGPPCTVVGLNLSHNNLDGELFESLVERLPSLQWINLADNALGGGLPSSLLSLGGQDYPLQSLALGGNSFDYSRSLATLGVLVQRCKDAATFDCSGLPPKACTAFGPRYMVRRTDPDTCERCGELWASVLLVLLGAIFVIAGISAYVYIINKARNLRKWVSTIGIVINHAQTLSILALLRMHWPASVTTAASFFSVDFFDWGGGRPECLASGMEELEEYGGVALVMTTMHVTLLLLSLHSVAAVQSLFKLVGRVRGWSDASIAKTVDRCEMLETILFSMQLTAGLRLAVQLFDSIGVGGAFPVVASILGTLLLLTQLVFVFKYYGSATVLATKLREEESDAEEATLTENTAARTGGSGSKVLESAAAASSARLPIRCMPWFGLLRLGPKNKSKERLQRRMTYLVRRYGKHAWYWQFVLWARQLLLTAVILLPDAFSQPVLRNQSLANSTDPSVALPATEVGIAMLQAILSLLIFVAFYAAHRRVQPFNYAFQNHLDGLLFIADIAALGLGTLYTAVMTTSAAPVVEACILVVMIGSLVGTVLFLVTREVIRKRRRRRAGEGKDGARDSEFLDDEGDDGLSDETLLMRTTSNGKQALSDGYGTLSRRVSCAKLSPGRRSVRAMTVRRTVHVLGTAPEEQEVQQHDTTAPTTSVKQSQGRKVAFATPSAKSRLSTPPPPSFNAAEAATQTIKLVSGKSSRKRVDTACRSLVSDNV